MLCKRTDSPRIPSVSHFTLIKGSDISHPMSWTIYSAHLVLYVTRKADKKNMDFLCWRRSLQSSKIISAACCHSLCKRRKPTDGMTDWLTGCFKQEVEKEEEDREEEELFSNSERTIGKLFPPSPLHSSKGSRMFFSLLIFLPFSFSGVYSASI